MEMVLPTSPSPSSPSSSGSADELASLLEAELEDVRVDEGDEEADDEEQGEGEAEEAEAEAGEAEDGEATADAIGDTVADYDETDAADTIEDEAMREEPAAGGDALEVSAEEAARMVGEERARMERRRRLYLVLDLDHTLLNSARDIDVPPAHEAYLAAAYTIGGVPPALPPALPPAAPPAGLPAGPHPPPAVSPPASLATPAAPAAAASPPAPPAAAAAADAGASGGAVCARAAEATGSEAPAPSAATGGQPAGAPVASGGEAGAAEPAAEQRERGTSTGAGTGDNPGTAPTAAAATASPASTPAAPPPITLFRLPHIRMWTKLRPGIASFLQRAHDLFDLVVYTNGERAYAHAMAALLDPTGRLFGGRVISHGDSTVRGLKDLDVVLGADSMVLILDDSEVVRGGWGGGGAIGELIVCGGMGGCTGCEGGTLDLDAVLGADSMVLILDDSQVVRAGGMGFEGVGVMKLGGGGAGAGMGKRGSYRCLPFFMLRVFPPLIPTHTITPMTSTTFLPSLDPQNRLSSPSSHSPFLSPSLPHSPSLPPSPAPLPVWPKHRHNLLLVERYHFFASSRQHFLLPGPSLLESHVDEAHEGGLLDALWTPLSRTHQRFFHQVDQGRHSADVRQILAQERATILSGCHLVFSRVFPTDASRPQTHPLWRMAESMGATCHTQIGPQITHVVALDCGTDKAIWAVSQKRHLVHPGWLEASLLVWKQADEKKFPVDWGKGRAGWCPSIQVVATVPMPAKGAAVDGAGVAAVEKDEETNRSSVPEGSGGVAAGEGGVESGSGSGVVGKDSEAVVGSADVLDKQV
ncbi:unnamed protein product [Closterium sp. NIES-64]|nr:unnamed protein product [Closterium sp. NIES-64]